jgi:hypothetical protein
LPFKCNPQRYTEAYWGHAVWVVVMIIAFVFGFPALIAFSLWYMSRAHKLQVGASPSLNISNYFLTISPYFLTIS